MDFSRLITSGALATLIGAACVTPIAALEMRPILTYEAAKAMADACIARAGQEGWKMHIAVVDVGGDLKLYARMDDAQLLSQDIAIAKATTSAKIPRPTKDLGERAFGERGPSAMAFVPGLNFFEGGLPIMAGEGVHIGGIGVSGSTGANDALCAQAGLDAAADMLK